MSTDLMPVLAARGIDAAQWSTLTNSLFPGANPDSVLMVVDYCRARKLDPLKKPCHIVPIWVKGANGQGGGMRDVVMPGIYEYRTTAQRTGQYMGRTRFEHGPPTEFAGVTAPEWAEVTVYRWHPASSTRIEFPARVYFREVCATRKDGGANDRWSRAPVQMLEKCAEAAALRAAFPDELGGEHVVEEIEGRTFEAEHAPPPPPPPPPAPEGDSAVITAGQLKVLKRKLDDAGLDYAGLASEFGVPTIEALRFDQLNAALAWVKSRA
jgi:phage recombination protein Bet